jgi:hypothetical protein
MDVKVDVKNVLPGNHQSLENAAVWLREHLNVPEQYTIFEQFEEYFNCRIDVDDRKDYWMQPNKVVFDSSAELMAFVLKWT